MDALQSILVHVHVSYYVPVVTACSYHWCVMNICFVLLVDIQYIHNI